MEQKILLLLLEQTRPYYYESIALYGIRDWSPLEFYNPSKQVLVEAGYYVLNINYTRGYLIRLDGCYADPPANARCQDRNWYSKEGVIALIYRPGCLHFGISVIDAKNL